MAGFLFNRARNGNVTAQIFWLTTRARWREVPSEHTHVAAVANCDVRDLTTDTLHRILLGEPVDWSKAYVQRSRSEPARLSHYGLAPHPHDTPSK